MSRSSAGLICTGIEVRKRLCGTATNFAVDPACATDVADAPDTGAKKTAATLIRDVGFNPVDLGEFATVVIQARAPFPRPGEAVVE
jgi:hypothetical protein